MVVRLPKNVAVLKVMSPPIKPLIVSIEVNVKVMDALLVVEPLARLEPPAVAVMVMVGAVLSKVQLNVLEGLVL